MKEVIKFLFFVLLGFGMGGILFSYHLPLWIKRIDITKVSQDHNPGTANVVRYAGVPLGLLCLLLDMAKGGLVVFWARHAVNPWDLLFAFVLAAPVLGHALAPMYSGIGGKGIAVSFGCLLALVPLSYMVFMLAAIYLFFSLIIVIRPDERRTVFSFALMAVGALAFLPFTRHLSITIGCCIIAGIVIIKNWMPWKSTSQPSEEPVASHK